MRVKNFDGPAGFLFTVGGVVGSIGSIMSKIRIGWIDHHLYTHHSQVFFPLIMDEIGQGKFEIVSAYESDRDPEKGDWCAEHHVHRAASPEEVVEASDVILVISPNNPEAHLDLARVALASGKPVYVDKYLAHTVEDAREMVQIARQHNTPLMTSSSLRFAKEVQELFARVDGGFDYVYARGMGRWRMYYGVHTIALALRAFGPHIKRLIDTGTELDRAVVLDDGARKCLIECHPCENQADIFPWELGVRQGDVFDRAVVTDWDQFYKNLVKEYLQFFETKESPISLEEQFATVAVEHAAEHSREQGGVWVDVARLD